MVDYSGTIPLKERNGKIKKQLWEEIVQILNSKNKIISFFLRRLIKN